MQEFYGVSEINYYLKEYLAENRLLSNVTVKGELSGCKNHSTGHIYFSLREQGCSLKGIMFRSYASKLKFKPFDGMEVLVNGNISFYERDGICQIYARSMIPASAGGAEAIALEKLKAQLQSEGIFDLSRKKPLPFLPESVGVVTSAEGAAWADIQKVARGRWQGVNLIIYNALVQGEQAPDSIANAIAMADSYGHSLLIVGRGGGANEDLAAFNSEIVVRAIASAQTPVISAVGHEVDVTLADLAADVRAATPTHAAELAIPDTEKLLAALSTYQERIKQAVEKRISMGNERINALCRRPALRQPLQLLERKQRSVDDDAAALQTYAINAINQSKSSLALAAASLEALSPLATLERGYALCSDQQGNIIKDPLQLEIGDPLNLTVARGLLLCRIEDKKTDIEFKPKGEGIDG